ncbi:MAG: hypothetical protein H6849_04930 [Alphaproteobacteria bacterium]|nr:MAG: hypothetical protein H6849_04930 [Alphaproteobacteria bacterium]
MNLRIHQRLVSKILHDLIAPASSTLNGIELLSGMQAIDEEVLSFMKEGAVSLNEKLKMFRLAFGATGDSTITNLQSFTEKTTPFIKVFGGNYHPVSADFMVLTTPDVQAVSVLIIMITQVATGPFYVSLSSQKTKIHITIEDLRFCFNGKIMGYLVGDTSDDMVDVDVHDAQAWLMRILADSCEMTINVVCNEPGKIILSLDKLPPS